MKSLARTFVPLTLAALFAVNLCAADEANPKKGQRKKAAPVFRLPEGVALSAEQQAKFDAIQKEYAPKRAELQKKLGAVLSDEQKAARKDAQSKAKADGLKGKEANQAVEKAANLTDAQKSQLDAIQKEQQALNAEVREKVMSILTAEQKAKLPQPKGKKAKKAAGATK